jgi:hypothetical protein
MTRVPYWALMFLNVFVVLSALGGGFTMIGTPDTFPREWLDGSPFSSYVVPGMVLAFVVGGAAAFSGLVMIRRPVIGAQLSTLAGLVLLGFIAVEVLLLHQNGASTSPRSNTELVFATAGLAMVLLGPRVAQGEAARAK